MVVTGTAVELRGLLRTRRVLLSDLSHAEVGIGRVGVVGYRRQVVVLKRGDGTEVVFKELNRASSQATPTTVESAVAAVNRALAPPTPAREATSGGQRRTAEW